MMNCVLIFMLLLLPDDIHRFGFHCLKTSVDVIQKIGNLLLCRHAVLYQPTRFVAVEPR